VDKRLFVTNHTRVEASTRENKVIEGSVQNGSIELKEGLDITSTKSDETSARFVNGRPHMKD